MLYLVIYFTSFHCTGRYELNKLTSLPMNSTGIAEVTGSNPVEALIFFKLLPSNCLNWKIYCVDRSSLSSSICKQFLNQRLVILCAKTAICLLRLHWWIYHTLSLLNETIEYWISLSELPQNIDIHGANIAVKFVFLKRKGNTCLLAF